LARNKALAKRFARREDLGLAKSEFAILRRLDTPRKIQKFLLDLKQNFEPDGDTCRPVRVILRERNAHCIEGAMLAACALWVHGEPPLVMDLRAVQDFDHVVALYRRNGRWGAISKTNGAGLRGRDPVYSTLRELAMSYLHEYCNKRDRKTLREYSVSCDLRRFDVKLWVSGEKDAWALAEALEDIRHFTLMSARQAKSLSRRDPFERRIGKLLQYPKPRSRRIGRGFPRKARD